MSTELATARTILDLIEEFDEKTENADAAVEAYKSACAALENAGVVMGTYAEPVLRHHGHAHASDIRKNLLKSGWKAIYNRLNIDMIASASDKRLFERTLADPPPLTPDTVRSTFAHYYANPRQHILRGLAEAFVDLDPAYKSHNKVRIGVKGLPKRVILSGFGGWSGYGRDRVRDIVNALAVYQGKTLVEYGELAKIADGEKSENRDVWLKRYENGNGHLYFGPVALLDINRGLADFYGEVLPDVDPEHPEKAPSTAVSKDLQFYWSPDAVISKAIDFAGIPTRHTYSGDFPPSRILEPSCGDGRILDLLAHHGHRGFGIEYHAGRAAEARVKGHSVLTANFLECPPRPEFDYVVMNPPFYGRHYVKHVNHALKFLKPNGILVAVLPSTAYYDHKELEGEWRDLPVGSFSEAGTNVPTGLMRMRAG